MATKKRQPTLTMSRVLEKHHGQLDQIDVQIRRLEQQRVLIKANALKDLHVNVDRLKIPNEVLGHLAAGCW